MRLHHCKLCQKPEPLVTVKHYIATYKSERNIFNGKLVIQKESPSEAMSAFFDWLKEQPVWNHLWRIDVDLEVIRSIEEPVEYPF